MLRRWNTCIVVAALAPLPAVTLAQEVTLNAGFYTPVTQRLTSMARATGAVLGGITLGQPLGKGAALEVAGWISPPNVAADRRFGTACCIEDVGGIVIGGTLRPVVRIEGDEWRWYVGPSVGGVWRSHQWAHQSFAPAVGAVLGGYVYEGARTPWRIEINPHASRLDGSWRFDLWLVMGLVL